MSERILIVDDDPVQRRLLDNMVRKFGYEPAPLVLAFVLGPMLENNLRKSLIL